MSANNLQFMRRAIIILLTEQERNQNSFHLFAHPRAKRPSSFKTIFRQLQDKCICSQMGSICWYHHIHVKYCYTSAMAWAGDKPDAVISLTQCAPVMCMTHTYTRLQMVTWLEADMCTSCSAVMLFCGYCILCTGCQEYGADLYVCDIIMVM